jgi:hypothetical protein
MAAAVEMQGRTPRRRITAIAGKSPGNGWLDQLELASLRSLRTVLQGFAGAILTAFPGTTLFAVSYWRAFGFAMLAAVITGVASFIQNVASFLPDDPSQISRKSA